MSFLQNTRPTGVQPDGDFVNRKADGQFFNTTETLAAGETYTSGWFDSDGFGTIEFFITADVPSARKGLLIEWTDDTDALPPTTLSREYYEFSPADARIGYKEIHVRPKLDGFRVTYTNGAEEQGMVYLSSTGRVYPEPGFENSGNASVVAEFAREVALGNVSNYDQTSKYGRNGDVDTGQPADIWNGGRAALGVYNYTGFNATIHENIQSFSSDAADVGALVSSGTITTNGENTVIDSTATFVSDGVSVGDVVLNDTRGTYGYVTSVDSEIQLTVNRMRDGTLGRYDNLVGNVYRVATATSTGAAVVMWRRILNADLERQTEVFVILNGVTPVTSTADVYRCSRGQVLLAGSAGYNVGEITCRQATTTANVFAVMPAQSNKTLICADTVPAGTIFLIEGIATALSISGGVAASAVVSLRQRPNGGVFLTERIYDLTTGGGAFVDDEVGGITLSAGTDFKLRVDSVSANNCRVSGKMQYLEIDEL